MSEWLDISSAPKDGTDILLFMEWFEGERYPQIDIGRWVDGEWHMNVYCSPPSYWMPLPKEPPRKHHCVGINKQFECVWNEEINSFILYLKNCNELVVCCPFCGEKA